MKLFFKDQLIHYRQTATSIIKQFIAQQTAPIAESFLEKLSNEIEHHGLPTDDIRIKIDLETFALQLMKSINRQIPLETIKLAFDPLLSQLNDLMKAVQDPALYLKEHATQLKEFDSDINTLSQDEQQLFLNKLYHMGLNSPCQYDWQGNSRLLLALMNEDGALASELISRKMFINTPNKNGITPLMLAAQKGMTDLALDLITNGAEINACKSPKLPYWTALYAAITARNHSLAIQLVEKGAKTDLTIKLIFNHQSTSYSLSEYAAKIGIDLIPCPTETVKMFVSPIGNA